MKIKHISGQSNDTALNADRLHSANKQSFKQFLNAHSRNKSQKWHNAGRALKNMGTSESQQIVKKSLFHKKVLKHAVIREQELNNELELIANNRHLKVARPLVTPKNTDQQALDNITQQFQNRFAKSASNKDEFHRILKDAFGDQYDVNKAEAIRQKTLNGDFSWMPKITLVDGSELNDVSQAREGMGLGAYSKDKDTVYLSRDLLRTDPAKAEAILSEEIGHALDTRLNTSDAAGDEGDIFSRLLHGESISQKDLTELRAENDSGVININGEDIEVEYGWFKKLRKKAKKAIKKVKKAVKKAVKKVGNIVIEHYKSIGKAVENGFKKIMQSELLGKVMMVAQFIPIPIVQAAVKVYNIAKGLYGVAQGIKNKSFGAVLSGAASIAGGVGKIGGALGASKGFVASANKVASTLQTASAVYGAAKNKDALGFLSAVGQFAPNSNFSTSMQPYLQVAQQGTTAFNAAKNGDMLGAIGVGASFAQNFTGDNADKVLGNIAGHAQTANSVKTAIETGNYAQAATLLKDNYAGRLGLSPEQQARLERTTDSLIKLDTARTAIQDKNYTQAANLFAGLAAQNTDDPAKLASLERAAQAVQNIDSTVQAYKNGDYASAANFAAGAMGHPLDDKTQAFLAEVQDTAHKIDVAKKAITSGDADQIANAFAELGKTAGINTQATDMLISAGNKAGKAQDLKAAIETGDFEAAGRILADSGVFSHQETPAQKAQTALQTAVSDFQKNMSDKAQNSTQFHQLMRDSFNGGYSYREAEVIRQQSARGDFSWMPNVEVRSAATMQDQSAPSLGGLQGAYSESSNTIYLSEGLLNGQSTNITRVLTEEAGHAIDAKISRTDSAGDEGNIFARLMSGETLSQEQLAGLRAENDSAVLSVAGESVTVEAAGMSDAALQSRIENLSDEDRTFFEGVKNGIVDTGMDIVNAAQLAYKLTTDPNERAKFAASVGKITDALANEETRSEAIKLIGSELGDGLLEAFNNFGNDPDYYVGYLAGSVAAGGAISKLAKFGAVATKLDKIVDTLKRVDIHTEGFGSNGGNIRVGLKPKFDKVTADNLDEVIKEFGYNAGKGTPRFKSWLNKGGSIEILNNSTVKYSIQLDGSHVSVIYKNGFPDFTSHLNHPSGVKSVSIDSFKPDNYFDYKAANVKAGYGAEWGDAPPLGYRWHHHEDLSTMQLVPRDIHDQFHHRGGASIVRNGGR